MKLKAQLKTYLDQGKSEAAALDLLLPEAFATVREVAERVLGLRHFEVQLLAGIGLLTVFISQYLKRKDVSLDSLSK